MSGTTGSRSIDFNGFVTPAAPAEVAPAPIADSVVPVVGDSYAAETPDQRLKRYEKTITTLREDNEALRAGREKSELTVANAVKGLPDYARTGVKLTEGGGALGELEMRAPLNESERFLIESEANQLYYGTDGRTATPKEQAAAIERHRQSVEDAHANVERTQSRVQYDQVLTADNVVESYNGMSEADRAAMLEDLKTKGAEGQKLAETLSETGSKSEAISSARDAYFYAKAKSSENSAVSHLYSFTPEEVYDSLKGKASVPATLPFTGDQLTAISGLGTPEASDLADVLRNPTDVDAINAAKVAYVNSDPAVKAAEAEIPRMEGDPNAYKRDHKDYDAKLAAYQAAQQAAIDGFKRDDKLKRVFETDSADLYRQISSTLAVLPQEVPQEYYDKLESEGTPEAMALAQALRAPDSAEDIETAMKDYALSLATTEADVEQAKQEHKDAKFKLRVAEHLPQYLDRAIDGRNQALLDRMGLKSVQFTTGEKIQGAANRFIVKPLKGIGVLANFGLDLIKTAEGIKSALGLFGIGKLPEEIIKKPAMPEGAQAFQMTEAGNGVAESVKEKAKPPESEKSAYDEAIAARKENGSTIKEFIEKLDQDKGRAQGQVERRKAYGIPV